MSFLKPEKSLSEIEEESIHEEAMINLKQKQLVRKQIEEKLGKGGMGLFKAKGEGEEGVLKKAANWLKSH
jgi:hypothetical protein